MSETQMVPEESWGVVDRHDDVERMLRERWDDPRAGEKDSLVVLHVRPCANRVIMAWLMATFMAAWERCKTCVKGMGATPTLRVLLWGGGDDELPLGHSAEEWGSKSVLSIGWWKAWMSDPVLASVVRCLYGAEQLPGDFDRVLQFVFRWCDSVYSDQQAHNLQVAYDAVVKEEAEFVGPESKMVKAVLIPADERVLASVALERGVALLVIREADGRATVNWNTGFGPTHIKTVARAIVIEERRAKEQGRESLSFDEVVKIASKVLNSASWEPGFAHQCKMGFCGSGRNGKPACPREEWRVLRCDSCEQEPEARTVQASPKALVSALVVKTTQAIDERSQTEAPAPPQVMDMTPSP